MNQELLDKVLECPRLPSLPSVAIEVIELCRQRDLNIQQIAQTISNDPALTTKILKTVNSSFYGLSQTVSTITHAIVILGLNSVKTLALGFTLVGTFKENEAEEFDLMHFWRRSLYSAVSARTIARHIGLVEHEEAFLGGLMQDLGELAMMQALGRDYLSLVERAGDDHQVLWQLERGKYDLDHTAVGGAMGDHWHLPQLLNDPIRFHEQPEKAPEDLRPIVRCVAAGSKAASVFLSERTQAIEEFFFFLHRQFGLDNNVGEQLLGTIDDATKEMARLFDINTSQVKRVEDILSEANETLLQLSLQTQQDASRLEQRNRELQQRVTLDPLTGVSNRGRFDEFLATQFDLATRKRQNLSLIFVDADHFKKINDTFGHHAGDEVLIALAKQLEAHCPDGGLVARYGGEEFAIIGPAMDRRSMTLLAEKIRQQLDKMIIDVALMPEEDPMQLKITASMGVATYDGVNFFRKPEQLIDAADKAVYVSKASGRNCVRAFAPKPAPTPVPPGE